MPATDLIKPILSEHDAELAKTAQRSHDAPLRNLGELGVVFTQDRFDQVSSGHSGFLIWACCQYGNYIHINAINKTFEFFAISTKLSSSFGGVRLSQYRTLAIPI